MGYPQHYSRELPKRCLKLIEDHWSAVADSEVNGEFGGPLTTTFLLALAAPMVVMPFERIYANVGRNVPSYANDADIDPSLTDRLMKDLNQRFDKMSFFKPCAWSVSETDGQFFNIADGLPVDIATALAEPGAAERAASMEAISLLSCLRNALSHGGVVYLDQHGGTTDQQVAMLAFVSAKMKDQKAVGLRIARISESGFREFLKGWVDWLSGD